MKPWKPDPKPLPQVADKVRVTCRICGMVTVKMSYNVAIHTREHQRHRHAGLAPDFTTDTLEPTQR